MAMKNEVIIDLYKIRNNMDIDEPLYTYAVWKKKGYIVKKGEKCNHKVAMWKYMEKMKNVDGEQKKASKCYMKTMCLFTKEQVEKIEK